MPRRKQDRPKRMEWEEGDSRKNTESTPSAISETVSDEKSSDQSEPDLSIGSLSTVALEIVEEGRSKLTERVSLPVFQPRDRHEMVITTENLNSSCEHMDDDGPLDFSLKRENCLKTPENTNENRLSPETQDKPLDLSLQHDKIVSSGYSKFTKVNHNERHSTKLGNPWVGTIADVTTMEVKPHYHTSTWNGKLSPAEDIDKYTSSLISPATSVQCSSTKNHVLKTNLCNTGNGGLLGNHTLTKSDGYRQGIRQNPWQSQWISRSEEQTKDVFTCVWCKESFQSLTEMTVHMKHSRRCGMAGMQASFPSSTAISSSVTTASVARFTTASGSGTYTVKESVPLPRKLVRGQDVWLGKGEEQTKEILKCMWCGQSFKTLADMTTHMRVTQHYINIISQEQLISWRSLEDKMSSQSHLNAVLTCKVCDQTFGSLKELSYHMVKNAHYKEHILRSITEGGGRRRQTKERRKKSLPVRKLLELERLELNKFSQVKCEEKCPSSRVEPVQGRVSCEECGEKVDAKEFVFHIKNCIQSSKSQDLPKAPLAEIQGHSSDKQRPSSSNSTKTETVTIKIEHEDPLVEEARECGESGDSTSVLNAIERLIEKSFENKNKKHSVCSQGILQRLGIDEEVCPPWNSPGFTDKSGSLGNESFGKPLVSSKGLFDSEKSLSNFLSPLSAEEESQITNDKQLDEPKMSGDSPSCSESSATNQETLLTSFPTTEETSSYHMSRNNRKGVYCPDTASTHEPNPQSPEVCMSSSDSSMKCSLTLKLNSSESSCDNNFGEPLPKPKSSKSVCINPNYGVCDASTGARCTSNIFGANEKSTSPECIFTPFEVNGTLNSEADATLALSTCSTSTTVACETPISSALGSSTSTSDGALPPRAGSTEFVCVADTATSGEHGTLLFDEHGSDIASVSDDRGKPETYPCKVSVSENINANLLDKDKAQNRKIRGAQDLSKKKRSFKTSELSCTEPRKKGKMYKSKTLSVQESSSGHPLKELQKLLDKTEVTVTKPNHQMAQGSLLAFSWACNEATASDSVMRCAFCDTHFISKGAYRHHLSKVHFVKDGVDSTWKSPSGSRSSPDPATPLKEFPPPPPEEESRHSKFLKYTELAKELSSKYV